MIVHLQFVPARVIVLKGSPRTLVNTLAAILLAVTAYLQISKQSIQIRGRTREQFPVLPIRGLLAAQNLSPVRNFILKSQFSEKV